MWALCCQPAHGRLINHSFGTVLPRLVCFNLERPISHCENYAYILGSTGLEKLNQADYVCAQGLNGQLSFSSQAGEKCNEVEDNVGDWFSEIGKPVSGNSKMECSGNADKKLISEWDPPQDDGAEGPENECELLEKKADLNRTERSDREASSPLFKVIMMNPDHPVRKILDQWVEAGNDVDQHDFWSVMLVLCQRQLYAKALQILEWWERTELSKLSLRDYASRVDLIAKVQGLAEAKSTLRLSQKSLEGK